MSDTQPALSTFEWTPPSAGLAESDPHGSLAERLQPACEDRGASAAEVVRRVCRDVHAWLCAEERPDEGIATSLRGELTELFEAQGWRGPVACLRDALEAVEARVPDDGGPALREALATECSYWLETTESVQQPGWPDGPPRVRLPDRSECARPLLEGPHGVEAGETILVHGWSETVARGVELAMARGLAPEVIVSEGGPDLGGRRLARRLVASGATVRFVYDAALVEAVRRADRVWLGTEAIGARGLLGRVGTRALLERARDLDVPTAVLATSDKLVPGGDLVLPEWPADEPWHLWEGAPRDVHVESQSFEVVPLDLVDLFATDLGALGPAEFAVQALRTG
ncbi:MAG: hypothetical protein AAF957_09865 [Planctomycetota bacterium]